MGGRPKAKIDPVEVEKLAAMHCTLEEIAAFCDVDKSTISRRFATEIAKGRERGKISLRRKQWEVAIKQGNVTMLIWLGKQYLQQREPEPLIVEESQTIPEFDRMSNEELIEYIDKRK